MKSWSLRVKLYFVTAMLVAGNVVTLTIGLMSLSEADESLTHVTGALFKRIAILNEVDIQQLNMVIRTREYTLATTPAEKREVKKDILGRSEELASTIAAYQSIASEKDKAHGLELAEDYKKWSDATFEMMTLVEAGHAAEADKHVATQVTPLRKAMHEALTVIIKRNADAMEEASVNAVAHYTAARNQVFLVFGFAVMASLALAAFVIQSFSKSIRMIVSNLTENSAQVASASTQIASTSSELSSASTEQASSLEETAASLEEISKMISKSSDGAGIAESSSAESQKKAEQGRRAVEQMLASMEEISQSNDAIVNQVNKSNEQMVEIVRVIQEIGNKTKVINEIVFQTKLLSFNASVEAARAGEHGKGFAVVAEEVGNLAQMSGNASKEISDMLQSSIAKVEQIVRETKSGVELLVEQGKDKVASGVSVARDCSHILEEIVSNVANVATLAQEISLASKEQSQGVGEINKAMIQLDTVTQQNSSTSEQTANAAEELSRQAASLKVAVSDLVFAVEGSSGQKQLGAAHAHSGERHNSKSQKFKASSKSAVPHNLVAIRSSKKSKTTEPHSSAFGIASGDGMVPSHDDGGFQDV